MKFVIAVVVAIAVAVVTNCQNGYGAQVAEDGNSRSVETFICRQLCVLSL